jgi:FkbM family methyltransferase
MSTRYFILQKPHGVAVADETKNQILVTAPAINYILPQNNLMYYAEHGLFEKHLMEWCKQFGNKEKTFLDIGAHSGTYCLTLASHFKDVHAFEPQRATFYTLCGSVALSGISNIECHRVGLGDPSQVGKMTLNIVSNDGGGSSVHFNGQPILAQETIEIRTLDSFGLDSIGFIKMDVEENELSVLKGAVETLKRCGYPKVLFESNGANPPLFDFLRGLGYTVTGISGVKNMFIAST